MSITERVVTPIDERIYGHFLDYINHSVEDGLYAEQIQGCGLEGKDFETYWKAFSERGTVEIVDIEFRNGRKSVRLKPEVGRAGITHGRMYVDAGQNYDGSVWVGRSRLPEAHAPRCTGSRGEPIASLPLAAKGSDSEEIGCAFSSSVRDTQASVELAAAGIGLECRKGDLAGEYHLIAIYLKFKIVEDAEQGNITNSAEHPFPSW